jgi:predicted GH43/DUF377 family glycosyl hydrolase
LIGAYFSHDVSPAGAALTNPSVVAHPDQTGMRAGELRFIMSARAIGEGHVSSIELRSGVLSEDGRVRLDPASSHVEPARRQPAAHRRQVFWSQLGDLGGADETAHLVLDDLGETFDRQSLELAIGRLATRVMTRQASRDSVARLRSIADNNYTVAFTPESRVSERVLVPTGPAESNGMEDARLVRFVDDDGSVTYLATYTAYDGRQIASQLLRTDDFVTFTAEQLCGPAARNKGMAIFPRRIAGRYACLSRWDRESSFVAWSEDGVRWESPTPIEVPGRAWDLVQVGNCGAPLETPRGWLVLTHGVGPMRTYTIGAMLLSLDDPRQVLATLSEPLVAPGRDGCYGYVPHVVYSCGALIHREHLMLPYGVADQAIAITVIDLPALMERLDPTRT